MGFESDSPKNRDCAVPIPSLFALPTAADAPGEAEAVASADIGSGRS